MKKLILLLSIFIFLIVALPAESANLYWRNCLTGGGDCLDGIDGASLADGDGAFVIRDNSGTYEGYIYRLEDTAETESSPDVISPDANAGNKRWRLVNFHAIGFTGPLTGNVTGNVTGDVTGGATTLTLADASTITPPVEAATGTLGSIPVCVAEEPCYWVDFTATTHANYILGVNEAGDSIGPISPADLKSRLSIVEKSGDWEDEQILCAETTSGTLGAKVCGAKTTYTEPGSNLPICRTSAGNTGACTNLTDVAPIAGTLGSTANYVPKASGTGGKTAQASGIKEDGTSVDIGALNLVTTGTIQGGIKISSDANGMTGAEMTTVGMYGTLFIATGSGTWTLPTAVAGMSICLADSGGTAHDLILDVQADDDIALKGETEQSNGVGITNAAGSTKGDFVCVVAISAGHWMTLGMQGTWASQ